MSSKRKRFFRTVTSAWWDFVPLLDWGDPALDDIGAAGFSLLPRRMDAPTLEHARTFLTVRFLSPSLSKALANEAMVVAPAAGETTPPKTQNERRGAWEHISTAASAVLHGTRSHQNRQGGLEISFHCSLHHNQPVLTWYLEVRNTSSVALRVESVTLLRVGPPHKVGKHRRSDFIPTRFRLFKLSRAPKTQSAYYDLTERFGSMRLHALDALPFTVQELHRPADLAAALPLPQAFAPPTYAALLKPETKGGLALAVEAATFPHRVEFKVNADPLAPGVTLRLLPTENLLIPAGAALALPATALAWLEGDTPAQHILLQP